MRSGFAAGLMGIGGILLSFGAVIVVLAFFARQGGDTRLARAPKAYWGAYAATKAALEMLVRVYADEVASTKIRANLIDPGRLRTALRARAYPGEKPESLPPPESVTEAFVALAEPSCIHHGALIVASKEGDHR